MARDIVKLIFSAW